MRGWGPLLSSVQRFILRPHRAKTDGGSYDSLCDSIIDGGSGEFLFLIDGAATPVARALERRVWHAILLESQDRREYLVEVQTLW